MGMFCPTLCWRCNQPHPRVYGNIPCAGCLADYRQPVAWRGIWFGVQVEAGFLAQQFHRKFERLHYLWCVLGARGSPFRKFTYFYAGLTGSISETENIIDRILSFLAPRCLP